MITDSFFGSGLYIGYGSQLNEAETQKMRSLNEYQKRAIGGYAEGFKTNRFLPLRLDKVSDLD